MFTQMLDCTKQVAITRLKRVHFRIQLSPRIVIAAFVSINLVHVRINVVHVYASVIRQ
jgi:hypothetical protein